MLRPTLRGKLHGEIDSSLTLRILRYARFARYDNKTVLTEIDTRSGAGMTEPRRRFLG